MNTDDTTLKYPWVAPTTVTLTDTDSRADQPDVALRNGFTISGGG